MNSPFFEILYEDKDFAVVSKLAPIPVQKSRAESNCLQSMLPWKAEAIHRIDQRASGLVLFGKNRSSIAALSELFRNGMVKKLYIACVERCPEPSAGTLCHWIVWDHRTNKAKAYPNQESIPGHLKEKAEEARLAYRLIAKSDRYWFLEIQLETGRHHQIRAQLSAIGCPVKGDLKYGARRSNPSGRILLHSWHLAFIHPHTGEHMSFFASPPADEPLYRFFLNITKPPADSDNHQEA